MPTTPTLRVDIWSDIACPWCYIGKRRFETALSQFPHAQQVSVHFRSFELDPSAPPRRDPTQTQAERLAAKYGMTEQEAQQRIDHVVSLAAAEGLTFDPIHQQSGNTLDAHRLIHLAYKHNLGNELKERLLRAYHCEGVAMSDHEALLRLADQTGLDPDEAQALLASDLYKDAVRADEEEAFELGISGVPFFRLGRYGVSGAQPADLLLTALQKAWSELPDVSPQSE